VAIEQHSASIVLRLQKWSQVVLAILFTALFVLLLPGGPPFGVPLGCLYIVWAVRARSDRRVSVWLAFLLSLAIAVLGGISVTFKVAGLLDGQGVSPIDLSIELTLFVVAVAVVALHAINWRWLLSRGTGSLVTGGS